MRVNIIWDKLEYVNHLREIMINIEEIIIYMISRINNI
jgi:hypothetical protein